jgi:hypothetical protein
MKVEHLQKLKEKEKKKKGETLVLFAICKEIKKCVNQSGQLFFVC